MRRTIKQICLILFAALAAIPAAAQIQFSIPDTNAVDGDTLLVPVYVDSSLTGQNVLSLQVGLHFSHHYLNAIGIETEGTLLDGWVVSPNPNFSGELKVAAAGDEALTGTGILFYVKFAAVGNGATYVDFTVDETYLNEGEPELILERGYISIAQKPQISVSGSASQIVLGDSVQFIANNAEDPVSWTTSDPDVATINQDGLLKAVGYGNVAVTAEDNRGITATSSPVKVYGFHISGRDTANYQGQEVSVDISTTDLSSLNVKSGSFFLSASLTDRIEVLSIERGALISETAQITSNVQSNGISLAFAQNENIAGGGHLLTLHLKLDDQSTFYNTFSFQDVLFNEDIEGQSSNFTVQSQSLPSLSISPGSGNFMVGDSVQFTVSNNTGSVIWDVTKSSVAEIDENGQLISKAGGVTKVTVEDSLGATATTGDFTFFDVELSFPDSAMIATDTIYYPVKITNVERSGANILANDFEFSYNQSRLDYLGFSTTGSLSEGWFYSDNEVSDGEIKLVGAGSNGIQVSGDVVYLIFKADTSVSSDVSAYVRFDEVLLNEGSPTARTENGNISISAKPLTPELVSPGNGAQNIPISPILDWNTTVGADSYNVQLSTSSSFNSNIIIDTTGVLSDELEVNTLEESTTYYWRVKAINESGESNWSNTFSFKTQDPIPAAPLLSSPENGAVNMPLTTTVHWEGSDIATNYRVEVDTGSDFTTSFIDSTVSGSENNLLLPGLNNGVTYYWRVFASNATGESAPSETRSFTTISLENQPPVVVSPLGSIELDEDFGEASVAALNTIFSDPEGNSLTFEVVEFDTALFHASLNSDTLQLASVQDAFGSGSVIVKAMDSEGAEIRDTLTVEILSVNDLPVITNLPDTLTFRNDEDVIIELENAISDVEDLLEDLEIQLSAEPGDIILQYAEDLYSVKVTAPGFTGEGTLTILVIDTDGGEAEASIVLIVETSVAGELEGEIPSEYALMQNYPNPFNPSSRIRFDLPESADVTIEVFSMLGQKVATLTNKRYTAGKHTVTFDAGSLSSGMYIYQIKAGDFIQTRKLTLIK